jgi:hypothetical protein
VEPLIELLTAWWWAAPATVGLGVAGYAGVTTGRRRARRLALDAARHEEAEAARALMSARAEARSAQAQLLTAQAQRGTPAPGVPTVSEARRRVQQAKLEQRSAVLALKASRTQVRAERSRIHGTTKTDASPLAQLVRQHDVVLARWIEYETDVETALAFPQMSDPQHPDTAAFLHAQRDAQWLRPSSPTARMAPADFVAYRRAVRAVEAAFTVAEDSALLASSRRVTAAPGSPRPQTTDTARPARTPASGPGPARTQPSVAAPDPARPAVAPPKPAQPESLRPAATPSAARPVWPVPGRSPRPPSTR